MKFPRGVIVREPMRRNALRLLRPTLLVRRVADSAAAADVDVRIGNVFSTDLFYHPEAGLFGLLERYGVLGVEMEAAGL